jgi:hypothetical protein
MLEGETQKSVGGEEGRSSMQGEVEEYRVGERKCKVEEVTKLIFSKS